MVKRRTLLVVVIALTCLVAATVAWSQQANPVPAKKPVGVVKKVDFTEHEVVPGDTLWDLGQRYYNDPWSWPLIWELNPQVADPHWIYPGQTLKIRLEKGMTVYGETEQYPVKTTDLFEPPNMPVFDTTFAFDTRLNEINLISPDDVAGTGEIVDNFDNQVLLGDNHEVVFRTNKAANVNLGDVFTIFRVQKRVEHPTKHDTVGYLINLLGELETIDAHTMPNGKIVYTGRIVNATSEIVAGDRLIAMDHSALRIQLKMTSLDLAGMIIQGPPDDDLMMGTAKFAFIDLGAKQGLEVGNSFSIWRASKDPENLPGRKIGNAIVVRVGQKVSTVLITNALREITVGDRVVTDVE